MGSTDPRGGALRSVFGSVVALSINTIPNYHSSFTYIVPIDTSGHGFGTNRAKGWFATVVFAHSIAPYK